MRKLLLAAAALASCASVAGPALSSTAPSPVESRTLSEAQTIRTEIDARYKQGARLNVREATTTEVVSSFTLLAPDLQHARIIPVDNGIYFAVCVVGAPCHGPHARLARPAGALLPRRIALELAIRTFLATSVDVVAVSLPTRYYTVFVIERDEMTRDESLSSLAMGLRRDPTSAASWARSTINTFTRTRVYAIFALEPTVGGETLSGFPLWPDVTPALSD